MSVCGCARSSQNHFEAGTSAGPTSVKLTERTVAMQHLDADDLHGQLQSSLTELTILGRRVSAEIRIRLLPMLKEAKRRYDARETVNKVNGYHAYLRSLGLTPSTVRSWQKRNEQKILGDVLKSTKTTQAMKREEKKYEQQINAAIEEDVRFAEYEKESEREEKEFERRLKEDPEFKRQHEDKVRQSEEWQKTFFENAKRRKTETPVNDDRVIQMMQEIIDDGFKQRAKKYHPDAGGSTELFQELNEAKMRLTAHVDSKSTAMIRSAA